MQQTSQNRKHSFFFSEEKEKESWPYQGKHRSEEPPTHFHVGIDSEAQHHLDVVIIAVNTCKHKNHEVIKTNSANCSTAVAAVSRLRGDVHIYGCRLMSSWIAYSDKSFNQLTTQTACKWQQSLILISNFYLLVMCLCG